MMCKYYDISSCLEIMYKFRDVTTQLSYSRKLNMVSIYENFLLWKMHYVLIYNYIYERLNEQCSCIVRFDNDIIYADLNPVYREMFFKYIIRDPRS